MSIIPSDYFELLELYEQYGSCMVRSYGSYSGSRRPAAREGLPRLARHGDPLFLALLRHDQEPDPPVVQHGRLRRQDQGAATDRAAARGPGHQARALSAPVAAPNRPVATR